jgi:hypothetical protein
VVGAGGPIVVGAGGPIDGPGGREALDSEFPILDWPSGGGDVVAGAGGAAVGVSGRRGRAGPAGAGGASRVIPCCPGWKVSAGSPVGRMSPLLPGITCSELVGNSEDGAIVGRTGPGALLSLQPLRVTTRHSAVTMAATCGSWPAFMFVPTSIQGG